MVVGAEMAKPKCGSLIGDAARFEMANKCGASLYLLLYIRDSDENNRDRRC